MVQMDHTFSLSDNIYELGEVEKKLLKKLVVLPKSLIFAKRIGTFGVYSVNIKKICCYN